VICESVDDQRFGFYEEADDVLGGRNFVGEQYNVRLIECALTMMLHVRVMIFFAWPSFVNFPIFDDGDDNLYL
jgi:hypothetical protein